MQAVHIPHSKTNRFSPLVLDYLAEIPEITPFFDRLPNLSNFLEQAKQKRFFSAASRKMLSHRIQEQYKHVKLAPTEHESLHRQILLLEEENTFTVTTGHQLCLFTGPLYVVYKILHAIKLAEELRTKLPEIQVVPIFWMASEDHDFEEVNHIRYGGHKLLWRAKSGDAVGRISTKSIANVLEELAYRLPKGAHAEALLHDLESAYLGQENLAQATRAIVHKWFGHLGIICIDGDDVELKKAMIPYFESELKHQTAASAMEGTNIQLAMRYPLQINPRPINLFYLANGLRKRIVFQDDSYFILGMDKQFSQEEMLQELQKHPERFSPNVVLRPLYQEVILPNLGYIGGGGEVAYWAQLKAVFEAFNVPFPIVLLRQSVQLVPKHISRKLQKLNLLPEQCFSDFNALSRGLVQQRCDFDTDINEISKRISSAFNELKVLATHVDKSLEKHVAAQSAKALNGIANTEKKLFRAAKNKENNTIRMLQESLQTLFPGGSLQERHDNIIAHWLDFGPDLINEIYSNINPLGQAFLWLEDRA